MTALPFTEQEIVVRSRQGVLRAEADRVAQLVGLTDKELAAALGLSTSYLHRLKTDQRISQDASERLLLLENLLQHALDTFEGRPATVVNWLRTPLRELDNQTPLQTLDTVTGYTLVDRVLGRIDHGISG
ncbi:DUF2384 domain-containing protein [Nibrella viscosa]|uniref:DUF2384 domain-containing protein n=2 Tax=Nibrella viscosa TaxID=1084524 RepID=A0ABP8KR25_9BACT